ncbi:hypothetical protein TNCV_3342291 [Trichonephila clavipes]|nr:hypothetical protein TNCV_3342291 [Trichonephila clavipes]
MRDFRNGHHHFEPWSRGDDDTRARTPSPNYHTTPTGGRLNSQQINEHHSLTRRVFNGSGLDLMIWQPQSYTLTTWLPLRPF